MQEQPRQAPGGRRPFGAAISDEQPPSRFGPLGAPLLPGGETLIAPVVARIASDAVHDKLEPTRIRFEALSQRTRAAVLIGAGALVTAVMWALALAGVLEQVAPRARGLLLIPLVVGPTVLAYGVMALLAPTTAPPPADDRFGGVLAEARAQMLWKMRLGAVAVGLVHLALFNAAT